MIVDIQPDAGLGVPKAKANGEHVNSGAYDGRHETRLEAASWRCESVPTPCLKIAGAHQLALHSAEYKRRRRDVAHTEREPDFEHLDFVSPKDGNRLGGEGDVTPPAFRLWRLEAQSRIRLFETALTWQRLSLCRPIAGPAVHPGAFLLQAQEIGLRFSLCSTFGGAVLDGALQHEAQDLWGGAGELGVP